MNPATYTIETTRRLLADEGFKSRHRASDQAFTRGRCLPFAVVLVLIRRKSVKSLQNVVNEAMAWLRVKPVTASAFSQARYQLQHPAFIELNQQAVGESRYRDANFRTFVPKKPVIPKPSTGRSPSMPSSTTPWTCCGATWTPNL